MSVISGRCNYIKYKFFNSSMILCTSPYGHHLYIILCKSLCNKRHNFDIAIIKLLNHVSSHSLKNIIIIADIGIEIAKPIIDKLTNMFHITIHGIATLDYDRIC